MSVGRYSATAVDPSLAMAVLFRSWNRSGLHARTRPEIRNSSLSEFLACERLSA
jgi:hypothetical protein